MKKNVLTIVGVVRVIAILGLIFMPREKLKEIKIPFINNNKREISKGEMKFISYDSPTDYQNGYFYFKTNDSRKNIMYLIMTLKKKYMYVISQIVNMIVRLVLHILILTLQMNYFIIMMLYIFLIHPLEQKL